MTENDSKFDGMNVHMIESQEIRRKHIVFLEAGGDVKLVEINEINKSKPGKHGAAKYNFTGTNLVTGKFTEFTEGSKTLMTTCELIKFPCILSELNDREKKLYGYHEMGNCDSFEMSYAKFKEEDLKRLRAKQEENPDKDIRFQLIETPYLTGIAEINVDNTS